MKVAVTGAAGFIGRAVVTALLERGVNVVAVLRPGRAWPAEAGEVAVVHLDITDPSVDAFDRIGQPDALIHLAWGGLPNYRSLHHLERELPAHYAFLAGLARSGLGALLVAGTCFEYGMQSGPLHEALAPAPANPYALAKDTLRRQLEFLRTEVPFAFAWARLFYLHGVGQAAGSLYPLLRRSALRGDADFPMSGGEQLRDYLPVEAAAGHLATLAISRCDRGIVNICAGQPVSVRAQVEHWIAGHGWRIKPALGRYPYPDHEPMAFWGDARRLQQCLGAA